MLHGCSTTTLTASINLTVVGMGSNGMDNFRPAARKTIDLIYSYLQILCMYLCIIANDGMCNNRAFVESFNSKALMWPLNCWVIQLNSYTCPPHFSQRRTEKSLVSFLLQSVVVFTDCSELLPLTRIYLLPNTLSRLYIVIQRTTTSSKLLISITSTTDPASFLRNPFTLAAKKIKCVRSLIFNTIFTLGID